MRPEDERNHLLKESYQEILRGLRLSRGEDPDPPERSIEELRAEVALKRAENDLLAAEMSVKRRRESMRVVES